MCRHQLLAGLGKQLCIFQLASSWDQYMGVNFMSAYCFFLVCIVQEFLGLCVTLAKITYIDEICAMQNQYLPLVSPFLVQYLTISISLQVLPLGQILWTSVCAKYNTRFQSPLRPNIALLLVFYVQWMDECFEKIVPLHKLLCIVHTDPLFYKNSPSIQLVLMDLDDIYELNRVFTYTVSMPDNLE